MRLYLTALNPTDAVLDGFLPAAASLGLPATVLTDRPAEWPADVRVTRCAVRDAAAVVAAAAPTRPVALLSNSDHLQEATAIAARKLGLPGKDPDAARLCKDKAAARRAIAAAGLDLVRAVTVDPGAAPEVPTEVFPAVVKPREGVASEDVVPGRRPAELVARVAEIRGRRPDVALVVEEYLDGELHTFETLGDGTELASLGGWHTGLGPPPTFTEETPRPGRPRAARPRAQLRARLDALGVGFGACHTEYVVSDGRARLIEVNYRLIGDRMDLILAELLGVPLFEHVIRLHLGEPLPALGLPDTVDATPGSTTSARTGPAPRRRTGPAGHASTATSGWAASRCARWAVPPSTPARTATTSPCCTGIGPDERHRRGGRSGPALPRADLPSGPCARVSARLRTGGSSPRVLDALLREDHLGLSAPAGATGPTGWRCRTGAGPLRIPVRADGFLQALRSAAPMVLLVVDDGDPQRTETLDGLLTLLAPARQRRGRGRLARLRRRVPRRPAGSAARRPQPARVLTEVAAERAAPRAACRRRSWTTCSPPARATPSTPPPVPARASTTTNCSRYAPEHAPRFALRWYAVPAADVRLAGELPAWWPHAPRPDQLLLPAHPITVARDALPVTDLPVTPVRPTLSMRTVALDHDPYVHLKLPLPTATPRRAQPTHAPAGLARRRRRPSPHCSTGSPPANRRFAGRIRHADESTWAHVDGDERRGFLLRRFPRDLAGVQVVPVAALPPPTRWRARSSNGSARTGPSAAGVLPGPAARLARRLWLRHGIALEAHPQNVHLLAQPDGTVGLLYKDNDGARLDARHDGPDGPRPCIRRPRCERVTRRSWPTCSSPSPCTCAAAAPLSPWRPRAARAVTAEALVPRLAAARDRRATDRRRGPSPSASCTPTRLPIKAMVTAGTLLPKTAPGLRRHQQVLPAHRPELPAGGHDDESRSCAPAPASPTPVSSPTWSPPTPSRLRCCASWPRRTAPRPWSTAPYGCCCGYPDVTRALRGRANLAAGRAPLHRAGARRSAADGGATLGRGRAGRSGRRGTRRRTGLANDEFAEQVRASRDAVARLLADRPAEPTPRRRARHRATSTPSSRSSPGTRATPRPKWRSGDPRQWRAYAPELRTAFPLHWLAVRDDADRRGRAVRSDAGRPRPAGPPHGHRVAARPPLAVVADRARPTRRRAATSGRRPVCRPTHGERPHALRPRGRPVREDQPARADHQLRAQERPVRTHRRGGADRRCWPGCRRRPGWGCSPSPRYRTVDVPRPGRMAYRDGPARAGLRARTCVPRDTAEPARPAPPPGSRRRWSTPDPAGLVGALRRRCWCRRCCAAVLGARRRARAAPAERARRARPGSPARSHAAARPGGGEAGRRPVGGAWPDLASPAAGPLRSDRARPPPDRLLPVRQPPRSRSAGALADARPAHRTAAVAGAAGRRRGGGPADLGDPPSCARC